MNWTEGNLARHSRGKAKNKCLTRQKQYFAKARNRLLNNSVKSGPTSISFFNPEITDELEQDPVFRSPNPPLRGRAISPIHKIQLGEEQIMHTHHQGNPHKQDADYDSRHMNIRPMGFRKRPLSAVIAQEETRVNQEKRQKLLKTSDWAGLTIQEPLKLSFNDPIRTFNRRPIARVNHTNYRAKLQSHHFAVPHQTGLKSKSQRTLRAVFQQPKPEPIRIRIGGQDSDTATTSFSSQISKKNYSFASPTNRSNSPAHAVLRQRACRRYGLGWDSDQESSLNEANHENSASIHYLHDPASPEKYYINQRLSRGCPHHGEPTQVVYASQVIHEPVPRRIDKFSVLRWPQLPSTSDNASIHGEVGSSRLSPHTSEIADSGKWMAMVRSSDNEILPLTRGSSLFNSSTFQPTISPGISDMHLYDDLSIVENPRSESFETPAISSTKDLADNHLINRQIQPIITLESVSKVFSEKAAAVLSTGSSSQFPSSPPLKSQVISNGLTSHKNPPGTRIDEDNNIAWREIVLNSNSDELENEAYKEAAHEVAQELRPSDEAKSPEGFSFLIENFQDDITDTLNIAQSIVSEEKSDDLTSLSTVGASHVATRGSLSSSPRGLRETTERRQSSELNMTVTESSVGTHVRDFEHLPSSISRSTVLAPMAISSDPGNEKTCKDGISSICATKCNQSIFRFSMPEAFVGKFAKSGVKSKTLPPPTAKTKGKSHGGKSGTKRKAFDGRMDFRNLPDFEGDPIEEYDED